MNWNAVCNASVATAALHALDDVERQARVVATAAHSLEHYLAHFDPDGCTAEGIGYWDYGFGHYVHLAATLAARTDGELSLSSPPIIREIAEFPLRVELSPGRYVPFSDSAEAYALSPGVTSWLGTHFGIEGLGALGRHLLGEHGPAVETSSSMAALRDLLWAREVPVDWERTSPPRRTFFDGHDWWIVRNDPADRDGLVVATKGGHNDEPHNHNDCGSFVVHYCGESLLTDLNRPSYDRDYFDDDHRYGYLSARSLGHSIPYVNGYEQAPGVDHAATVIDRESGSDRESITYDIGESYPEDAGLASLERAVTLDRGESGRVTVRDRAALETGADDSFESVLVSYFPMELTDAELVVTGDRARATVVPHFQSGDATVDVERLPEAVKGRDVWRARIARAAGDAEAAEDPANPATIDLTLAVEVARR
jgi:hypothetical protein